MRSALSVGTRNPRSLSDSLYHFRKGYYKIKNTTFTLQAGDSFLVYPNTEVLYFADESDPWEYAWVGFTGSDASMILKATDFSTERPVIEHTPLADPFTGRFSIFMTPEEMSLNTL